MLNDYTFYIRYNSADCDTHADILLALVIDNLTVML